MNASMLTSDRVTHLKIGMTAALATAVVIMIGVYARPSSGVNGLAPGLGTGSAIVVSSNSGPRPLVVRVESARPRRKPR